MSNNQPILKNYIGGNWVDSNTVKETTCPVTNDVLGQFYEPSAANFELAVKSAKEAFYSSTWKHDRQLRALILNKIADKIEEHKDELIYLISKENGKILPEAGFEFSLTPSKLRYYASLSLTDSGKSAEVQKGVYSTLVSEPIGVAGVIVPWNSPLILSVRSFAPALAAGCTCVIKMPAQTALVNNYIAKLISEIEELPAGVLNFITEAGSTVAKGLVEHPDVKVISYTGSTTVGKLIMKECANNLKRVNLELGGKTPMILFEDANLDQAIPTLVAGITTFTGQFCMTGSRILVHESIKDEVEAKLKEALENVKVGPGTDENSGMGPLIDENSAIRVDKIVEEASKKHRVIVRGGRGQAEGQINENYDAFYRPSLIEVNDLNSPLIQEEVFGPVATFETFTTDEEAIEMANATKYGLSTSVWTNDRTRAQTLPEKIEAGTVWVNGWGIVFDQFEEGGFKQSGLGRLNGTTALVEFQEFKHVVQAT